MKSDSLAVADQFKKEYQKFKQLGLINSNLVINWSEANERSFHSIIQGALVKAGNTCGYTTIPEYKCKLKQPFDKKDIDARYQDKNTRKQHSFRADIAFFEKDQLKGLGEIYTLDGINACEPAESLETGPWATAYHKLPHLVKYVDEDTKPSFLIIINILPRTINPKKLPWPDARKHTIEEYERDWKKLTDDIGKTVKDICLAIIRENDIDIYTVIN